jgi:NAD(P)H-dependent flavin oxidoreductase YrpB (nitropropane dioxygenase family)
VSGEEKEALNCRRTAAADKAHRATATGVVCGGREAGGMVGTQC